MKTIAIDRISLVKDYITDDYNRKNGCTQLQYHIWSLKENIITILKRKEEEVDEEMDRCIYQLTYTLTGLEMLLNDIEAIREEGNC